MKVSNGGENKSKDYVNDLRVNVEDCIFKWELSGFKDVPFMTEYPVFSPSFILGTGSESVWQLLMAKEFTDKKKNELSNGKKPDTEVSNIKTEPEPTEADMAHVSGADVVKPSDSKVDSSPSLDSELTPEERLIGFKLIKTEEGSSWDVINYHVQLTIGDVASSTVARRETGSPYGRITDFLYVSVNDFEGMDLDNVEKVTIQAFIEYTYLDFYPLVPAGVKDGDQFTQDICRLSKSEKFSDVTLVAGQENIPAHKGILCCRAYGFDCHLQEDSDFVKQKINLDMEECVARAMLAFIYCGGLPVEYPLEKCKALSAAADKYKVNGLKSVVTEFFKNNLDPEICNQCLSLGDSDLDSIDLSEDQLRSILQKKGCSHKPERKE